LDVVKKSLFQQRMLRTFLYFIVYIIEDKIHTCPVPTVQSTGDN